MLCAFEGYWLQFVHFCCDVMDYIPSFEDLTWGSIYNSGVHSDDRLVILGVDWGSRFWAFVRKERVKILQFFWLLFFFVYHLLKIVTCIICSDWFGPRSGWAFTWHRSNWGSPFLRNLICLLAISFSLLTVSLIFVYGKFTGQNSPIFLVCNFLTRTAVSKFFLWLVVLLAFIKVRNSLAHDLEQVF